MDVGHPPTPRAQVARIALASMLAVAIGAAPAVVWDVSTELPHATSAPAAAPSARSPWKGVAHRVVRLMRDVARVYLPRRHPAEPEGVATELP